MLNKLYILLIVIILMINNLIECHKSELCLRQISKCDKKQQQQDCRTPCPGVYHITCGSKYCAINKLSCSKFQVEKVFSTISNTSTILNCPLLTVQNNLPNRNNKPCLDRTGCDLKQMMDWNWRNKIMSKF